MGHYSVWHWIITLVVWGVPMIAFAAILRKAGYSPWWTLVWLVPLANIIALFIFAFSAWPVLARGRDPEPGK